MLECALEYIALRGVAPQMVGGDLNFPLDDLHQPPAPGVLASLLAQRLVNADAEITVAAGRAPVCSYLGLGTRRPSRIDGLLVGTCLAPLLLRARPLSMGGIPGHRSVCFGLHLQGARQRVLKLFWPCPVTPLPWQPGRWTPNGSTGMKHWERGGGGGALGPLVRLQRGPGMDSLMKEVCMCHRLRGGRGRPATCPLVCPQAVLGSLRPVLRWLSRPDPRLGPAPR